MSSIKYQARKAWYLIFGIIAIALSSCDDDDSIDYTKYYGWRNQNNELNITLLNDARTLGSKAYFSDSVLSLTEPYSYPVMVHVIASADEDSLRKIDRWYTPYFNSTLKVHYTLFDSKDVYRKFEEYGILSDANKRNDAELMNKVFGIGYLPGMDGHELKADTLESSQVKFFENFTCSSVIKGWQDCLQRMHIGDNWLIMVPWYLGYGQAGTSSIDPYSNLYFRINLVDITTLGDNKE